MRHTPSAISAHLPACPSALLSTCLSDHTHPCPFARQKARPPPACMPTNTHQHVCPPIRPPTNMPTHPHMCPPVHVCTHLSAHAPTRLLLACVSTRPLVHLPVHSYARLLAYTFARPPTCPSASPLACPPAHLLACLPTCSLAHLPTCPPTHTSSHLYAHTPTCLPACTFQTDSNASCHACKHVTASEHEGN